MAENTVNCSVCGKGPFDSPNDLWSHIRMSARHENSDGDHMKYWNQEQEKESDSSADKLEEMRDKAQEEKEKDLQMVETPEKPSDEPEYRSIREIDTEEVSEKEKKYLLALLNEGYEEIEDASEKDIEEREVR